MGLKKHTGGCILIGSGPSLGLLDIGKLAGLDSIAFNRSYIVWNQWGFSPTYYACLDPIGFLDRAADIKNLIKNHSDTHFFLPEIASDFNIDASTQVSLVALKPGSAFSGKMGVLTDFRNIGATSLQILALLGYQRIAMIGVDASYVLKSASDVVPGISKINEIDTNASYFCAEYAQGGRLITNPNLEEILAMWPDVAKECIRSNIDVRNASGESALGCFPKIDFDDAIEWIRGSIL